MSTNIDTEIYDTVKDVNDDSDNSNTTYSINEVFEIKMHRSKVSAVELDSKFKFI